MLGDGWLPKPGSLQEVLILLEEQEWEGVWIIPVSSLSIVEWYRLNYIYGCQTFSILLASNFQHIVYVPIIS